MKKFSFVFIFIILIIAAMNIEGGSRVFDIKNPAEIFIDLNKNLIFDETEPVKFSDIHYIDENTDFNKYPFLSRLNEDEKFFLKYKAFEAAETLLKNRYVKFKNGEIYTGGRSYREEILKSKFVFDDTEASQKRFLENIKAVNLDDYVILNIKNRKYHKLNCENGRKSNNYKIVKKSQLPYKAEPCRKCMLQAEKEILPAASKLSSAEVFSKPDIKIFFIDLNKTFKPDNTCNEAACRALKNEIDKAEHSIDFAVYGINNQPEIMNALIRAHKRGVKIRRVYDWSSQKYYEDNDKLDGIIKTFKTDEEYDKNKDAALMHNKYFIFDGRTVFTGSSNISSTDLSGFNSNFAVLINSKDLAERYKEDFEQMYKGVFHKSKKRTASGFIEITPDIKVKALFSPQDDIINSQIIPLINSARKYIYIPAFLITDKKIEQALINASKRGIDAKIIIDAVNAHSKYTVHKRLRADGIKVKTENYAGKVHAKTIIIDDEYLITGSMNFTRSGNSRNDENMLIIRNKEAAEFMRAAFMELWNKIPEKYASSEPAAESPESIGSCYDGIDNDFDDKIDSEDEGCMLKPR